MSIIFTKLIGRSLAVSPKQHKETKEGGRYENKLASLWARYALISLLNENKECFTPTGQEKKNIFDWS